MGADYWKSTTLRAIARLEHGLVDGPFGSNLPASVYTASGVPVIRGSNLSLGGDRFCDNVFVFVSEQTASRLSRSLCRAGDIIFTKKGTLGQTGIIPASESYRRFLLSSNQMKLTVDTKKADPLFVYYYMSSPKSRQKLVRDSSTTGVPKTNLAYLGSFPILLPPLQVQRTIAHILGTLDDKIELNRRMSRTLEEMARALFKSWFVDFDPVRAKAEGHEPVGMDAETAALFPDAFENSEMGRVPRGWCIGKLGSEFDLKMGQSPPGSTYNEHGDGLPFYQGRKDFGFRFPSRRVFCSYPGHTASRGDTLVTVRAPVGALNMANEACCIGRGIAAVRHKTGARSYTYYSNVARSHTFALFESQGTVFGALTKQSLSAIDTLVPPKEAVLQFEELVAPFDDQIELLSSFTFVLENLRNSLLPKLLSGDLRIDDPESFLEDHLP